MNWKEEQILINTFKYAHENTEAEYKRQNKQFFVYALIASLAITYLLVQILEYLSWNT